ncbi:Breast cancer anti-estrogen resistance protein 3-like protein [Frankliniella fusca]|uniref:Breast cancer anti-estrogen resistance protein 3-like protein n=1 Tax=Frankliniella fusca TaxID=407009 RepID=A0AAE1GTS5_9NEOP|nr:Breast cancer anti-estrogen resistance protein 3-like protein [Frankliniella fusca]
MALRCCATIAKVSQWLSGQRSGIPTPPSEVQLPSTSIRFQLSESPKSLNRSPKAALRGWGGTAHSSGGCEPRMECLPIQHLPAALLQLDMAFVTLGAVLKNLIRNMSVVTAVRANSLALPTKADILVASNVTQSKSLCNITMATGGTPAKKTQQPVNSEMPGSPTVTQTSQKYSVGTRQTCRELARSDVPFTLRQRLRTRGRQPSQTQLRSLVAYLALSRRLHDEPAGDPTALRRLLEWELSLDSQDLRSHAWYHGAIPRHRAEEIVERDGDFLVRDCASQPGNYVLTCRSKGAALHFVINKVRNLNQNWNRNQPRHVVLQPDTVYERVQFQFEADAYDTVPDLVTYYVGSGKPISAASGARIQSPRNRLYPLSFYAEKYALQGIAGVTAAMSPLTSPLTPVGARMSPYSCFRSPVHSPPRSRRAAAAAASDTATPPRLPSKQRSLSLTPVEAVNGHARLTLSLAERARPEERGCGADGVVQNGTGAPGVGVGKFSAHSLPRSAGKPNSCKGTSTMPRHQGHHAGAAKMLRVNSDLEGVASARGSASSRDAADSPPPKPRRVPSAGSCAPAATAAVDDPSFDGDVGDLGDTTPVSESGSSLASAAALQRAAMASYHASGSDSGNGSGDSSAQSSAAGDIPDSAAAAASSAGGTLKRGVVMPYLPSSCSSTTLKACDDGLATPGHSVAPAEPVALPSALDLDGFQTLLLPSLENKPLDATALQGIKMMLLESGSRILANHLTRDDLELTLAATTPSGQPWDHDLGLGVKSAIELCTLPIGHQLRTDLVERTECLKLLVAVTILTCPTEVERAELLNKWIQVAVDTKTALGNLYGFCGIMLGLCMPQLQRLAATWHVLRQRFTDSAFNFEAKLRPTLKSMNECSNPQAPNTTIPHLLPLLLLSARTSDTATSGSAAGGLPQSTLNACLGPWESSTSDFGLGVMWAHLEAARRFCDSLPTFRRNSQIVLGDSKVDDLLLDAFRTEFHLKFLWGSRGATVHAEERHAKFDQVLTVMSEKCEPPPPAPAPPGHAPAPPAPVPQGHASPHAHLTQQSIGTSV